MNNVKLSNSEIDLLIHSVEADIELHEDENDSREYIARLERLTRKLQREI